MWVSLPPVSFLRLPVPLRLAQPLPLPPLAVQVLPLPLVSLRLPVPAWPDPVLAWTTLQKP